MQKPPKTSGLRHLALWIVNFEACQHFYCDLLDMQVEWQPDADNLYLTSGHDNLALHRAKPNFEANGPQKLDHLGFILNAIDDVDQWYEFFLANDVTISMAPKTHRDGARSFYCKDPDGNNVQLIYHPPLAK